MSSQSVDERTYNSAADTGSDFRISRRRYNDNLAAGNNGPGSYRIDIVSDGHQVGSACVALTRPYARLLHARRGGGPERGSDLRGAWASPGGRSWRR